MSTQPNEKPNNENGEQGNQPPAINPKWNPLLEVLPDDLHGIVTPYLKEWDQGVNQRFQEIREEYNPYKEFVEEKVDPLELKQALALAQAIQNDPATVVQRMVDHFNLEQYKQQQQSVEDEDLPPELEGLDVDALKKHPAFKDLFQNYEQMQNYIQSQQQSQEEQTAQQQIAEYLKELHEKHDDEAAGFKFDDTYVTTMLAAGVDGDQAVQMFKGMLDQARAGFVPANQTQQQTMTPPVVMGGADNSGSGVPNQPVKFGQMKTDDLNNMVQQYLSQAANENNT